MSDASPAPKATGLAFAYVTTLFFAWGFATSLIDPLIAAVKGVFDLDYTDAFLTQFAWFTAYGVVSLPAAALLGRLGYARAIVSALGVMVLGALIVPAATVLDWYPGVLIALFVIAAGVTLLQVAANPLAASLGSRGGSHLRLVLSQAFNSLGTVMGPLLGATVMLSGGIFAVGGVSALGSPTALLLILLGVGLGAVAGALVGALRKDAKGWIPVGLAVGLVVGWVIFVHDYVGALAPAMTPAMPDVAIDWSRVFAFDAGVSGGEALVSDPESRARTLRNIDAVFLGLAAFFAVLGGFIWTIRNRLTVAAAGSSATEAPGSPLRALRSRWAVLGAVAIFIYVGAEVTVGSLMTNFLASPITLSLAVADAGRLVALYWAGAMAGRFAGSALLTRVPAAWLLAVCTAAAAVLCLVVTQSTGVNAALAALLIGLFNSVMFPAIFTLTLERSTAPTSATSGLMCMAIIGGAILPLAGASLADAAGGLPTVGFYVPLVGYLALVAFAVLASRAKVLDADSVAAPSGH